MSETAQKILVSMLGLVQTRGYSAVSYQDIADELGIRKASIHYHFPTKAALGVAVVEFYQAALKATLETATGASAWSQLDSYLTPIREFSDNSDRICLCGALAGEYLALPDEMQSAVARFFDDNQRWLENVFASGRDSGEFSFKGSARRQARLVFSALQGALLIKRATGDSQQLHEVIDALHARLRLQ